MENNLLLALFILLASMVALVPMAKFLGLGTILGYLAAGVLIGPYGLGLVSDSELIHQVSDFGIVMMLFLIGLELQPRELWRMRQKMLGLGLTQLVLTTVIISAALYLTGFGWRAAVIIGLALAMSSTAIAMQSAAQRDITRTETGRAGLSILLVQDIAVIPILAAIPVLAASRNISPAELGAEVARAAENPVDWLLTLRIIGAFLATMLAARFLVRPIMHFVARSGVREVFTAMGLALVIGAALVTQFIGLSPALGAFLGGVLLADSEYRHELESNLEPFKGLLLGLFFISVGMSIAFSVLLEFPALVAALVIGLVAIKMLVLYGLAAIFRMVIADRLMLAILLSQAGEFAFVVLQFASRAGALTGAEAKLLTVVVALSMATTPILLFVFDRLAARRSGTDAGTEPARFDQYRKVIVLGYGRFGQIVTRMLRAQGVEMTLIDDDPAQIATVRRFGVKVFYGDGSRLGLLHAAGAAEAQMIVIAVGGAARITAIASLIRRHFPHVTVASRAVDRSHAHELMALGVEVLERETFRSAIGLGMKALVNLGYPPEEAARMANDFEAHDTRLLHESYAVRHDEDAYIGMVRRSMGMLGRVMEADEAGNVTPSAADPSQTKGDHGKTDIDKPALSPSD